MFTRKTTKRAFHPLTMALTVVILLAMLVPAAAAAPEAPQAPEWVHGVTITYPTEYPSSAFVDPFGLPCPGDPYTEREGDQCFRARFNLTIEGTQVDDVEVRFRAIDQNTSSVVWTSQIIIASNALQTGVNARVSDRIYPGWDPGWYRFEICARDLETRPGYPDREWFCDVENYGVFVDLDDPGARLIKPVNGAWLNGTELLVGKAWDPWWAEDDPLLQYGLPKLPNGGIKSARFDYCVITNWQTQNAWCGPNDQSWVTIATANPTPGVPYQYDAMWDTTAVPDDWGYLRFCATDFVNRTTCDTATYIFTNNRYYVELRPGWNLVSTPLMLYNDNMCDVLLHIQDKVTKVYWDYDPSVSNTSWKMWTPANCAPPPSAAKFEHGKGYWIYMKAPARLAFIGSWKNVGNQAPPEYGVATGWNLIGYTPWGQPVFPGAYPDRTAADYLQGPVASAMQALWRYDAASGVYYPLYATTPMWKGYGYWLAVARAGVIRP